MAQSTQRRLGREQAFARLDALPFEEIRGVSYTRAAALAGTSEVYVRAWITARGYQDLRKKDLVEHARKKGLVEHARKKDLVGHARKPFRVCGPREITPKQLRLLSVILRVKALNLTWQQIGAILGLSAEGAYNFWKTNRHRLKR